MRNIILPMILAIGFSVPALAAPSDMSVAIFLGKAEALRAKGVSAMLSSDIGLVKAAATSAGQDYRARLVNERAAGHPSSCPAARTKMDSKQLISHLKTYPVSARPQISMRQAMSDYFIRNWPCK